jgi:uncharacterized DUF497 family protein
MDLRVSGFDWDEGNRSKCQKHGLSIAEIEAFFMRGPRVAPDPKHSADEVRFIAVGRTSAAPRFRGLHNPVEEQWPFHPPANGEVHAFKGGRRL